MGNSSWLKQLKALWTKRLAATGFVDCELPNGTLRVYEADKFRDVPDAAATVEYYRLATKLLYTHKFECTLQRDIWLQHALGDTNVAIARKLNSTPAHVAATVRKLRIQLLTPSKVLLFTRGPQC